MSLSGAILQIKRKKAPFFIKKNDYKGKELSEQEKTVDHKIPVSKGGTNAKTNLVICCRHCNSLKNDKEVI